MTMKTVLATNSEYLRASFLVAYKIAKTGRPYNIAEELILPTAKDMVSCVLGDKFSKLLDKIPLSNDTIARRIHKMAEDVENQLAQRLQNNHYAIQVDESIDISGLSNLLGFDRYVYKNICKDFVRPWSLRRKKIFLTLLMILLKNIALIGQSALAYPLTVQRP